jgi:putative two-component system response regulator
MAKRILAVDDDDNILNLEKTILVGAGYEVVTARGAREALDLLAREAVDLVLLDVVMPEMSGFELCRKIRAEPRLKDLPVVFLTARAGGDALAEGFEAGGTMYIRKPFTAAKMLAVVGTMLKSDEHGLT